NSLRSNRRLTCSSLFFFSSRRRHTRFSRDWSSDVCSSDLRLRKRLPHVPVVTQTFPQPGADERPLALVEGDPGLSTDERRELPKLAVRDDDVVQPGGFRGDRGLHPTIRESDASPLVRSAAGPSPPLRGAARRSAG